MTKVQKPILVLKRKKAPARSDAGAFSNDCGTCGAAIRDRITEISSAVKPLAATPKDHVKIAAIKTRKVLAKRFPKCFQGFGKPKLPLKIGIHEEIFAAAPELPRRSVLYALADYVGGYSYLKAHIEGATRVDLNGEAAGVVTAEDEQYARKRYGGTVAVPLRDIATLIIDGETIEQTSTRDKQVDDPPGYFMVPVRPAGPGWFIYDSSSDKCTVWRRKVVSS
jgi:hypothetical protein